MKPSVVLALVVAAGCGSSEPSGDDAKLAHIAFQVPAGWHRTDSVRRGVTTAIWTPDGGNDRKESITVIETELVPAAAGAGTPTLERLLASAQPPDAGRVQAVPASTRHGLSGARVEVDFVPPGQQQRYHRSHVVLVDGNALVHVLYTAQSPDDGALDLVLSTLHHEEA